jgi:hypothetical protein
MTMSATAFSQRLAGLDYRLRFNGQLRRQKEAPSHQLNACVADIR